MQQSSLFIPQLETRSQAFDLTNSLLGVSGIGHVTVDESTGTLTVEYDPTYLSEAALMEFVKGAGYPSAGNDGSP
jgi:copper chaperone CopZ